ncbi:MAG: C25 family cysteine peptidase, partial [Sedimentisphaerales bacterium]
YGYEGPPDGSEPAANGEREDDAMIDTEKRPPYTPLEQLAGLPVVVLQSCHSLEEPTNRRILDLGGAGLVGSTTNVYSASGSAFVKAFCDGLLYRNQTVGEALRDARNYFLCLAALKKQRGHKETAKTYRAALSFGFWGDPEIRLFPPSLRARKDPVSAAFTGPHTVKVSTPRYRLAEAKNEKYLVRMFPGSQVAGIVRKLKNEPIRRLTPLYFFTLAAPAGFDADGYKHLEYGQSASERSVFLEDPFKRFVYILYFPEKEAKSDTLFLQFVE